MIKRNFKDESENNQPKKFKKEICKYGSKCYRRNILHLSVFDHPQTPDDIHKCEKPHVSSQSKKHNNIYLTKIKDIESKDFPELSLSDILSAKHGRLIRSAQFNYIIDYSWLILHYPNEFRKCPMLLVHGGQVDLSNIPKESVDICEANLPIEFGTHHTKMMLLLYEHGLRVVIHTANLIERDWELKTQGIWMSPIFPLMKERTVVGDSLTGFKKDLIEYLMSYNKNEIKSWITIIQAYDFSSCRVYLICSSPGRHSSYKKDIFGHLKLRKVLLKECESIVESEPLDIIAQFSSIGSLGVSKESWLTSEFQSSLVASMKRGKTSPKSRLHLIYPCVEDVRNSLEGYMAGTSLPYTGKVHNKQLWLRSFLRKWKGDISNRTRASPHLKSYMCTSNKCSVVHWFMITSANLSKAAWGSLEKSETQLTIRSYEVGVLLLPKYYGVKEFTIGKNVNPNSLRLDIPFDLPPKEYGVTDEPWIVDCVQRMPDSHGNSWYQ